MANERMCSETGELMSQWSGGSKVSVNGGTTQMVRWKQGQCEWGDDSNGRVEARSV
jgi:hypothetical protein